MSLPKEAIDEMHKKAVEALKAAIADKEEKVQKPEEAIKEKLRNAEQEGMDQLEETLKFGMGIALQVADGMCRLAQISEMEPLQDDKPRPQTDTDVLVQLEAVRSKRALTSAMDDMLSVSKLIRKRRIEASGKKARVLLVPISSE